MRERASRTCLLRVEVRSHGILSIDDRRSGCIGDAVLNVARLAAGTQADDQALGGVAGPPS